MITFRYREETAGNKGKTIKRPVADISLQSFSGKWIEFHPYIDSGADVTLIPLSLGKLLGLTVDERDIQEIGGIRGSVPIIYHEIKMMIGEKKLKALIGWALIEEVPPLLGRVDVFDTFEVTFRQREGIILFKERNS